MIARRRFVIACLFACVCAVVGVHGQNGTPLPFAVPQFLDNNGALCNGCKLFSYTAGTLTPLATYQDAGLSTPNANPVVLDAFGRGNIFPTQATYKYVLTTSAGSTLWTIDNIASSAPWNLTSLSGKVFYSAPTTLTLSSNAVTPTQNVHKLDTSGGAQNLNTLTIAGSVASGFVLHLTGNNPGANPVTVKDGAGNISLTGGDFALSAANKWISLILNGSTWYELSRSSSSAPTIDNTIAEARCTLTSGTPVTTADVTAATTVYVDPMRGNRIALYDGTNWNIRTFSELSIALGSDTANANYDLFMYDNAGTPAIERLVWASDTARATNLTLQDGVLVKNAATTRRYLCTYRTTAAAGQTEDSYAKRYVWNYYNRVRRPMRVLETTASWTYTTATWRQANAATTNQLDFVLGWAETVVHVTARGIFSNSSAGGIRAFTSIGFDSTSVPMSNVTGVVGVSAAAAVITQNQADIDDFPAVGRHTYVWLEQSEASGTATWWGKQTTTPFYQSGIFGWIEG